MRVQRPAAGRDSRAGADRRSGVPGTSRRGHSARDGPGDSVEPRTRRRAAARSSPCPCPGDPELYAADLWFMVADVVPRAGRGRRTAGSRHRRRPGAGARHGAARDAARPRAALLAGLGLFLAVGLLTIIGAAVRESVVPPGEAPDACAAAARESPWRSAPASSIAGRRRRARLVGCRGVRLWRVGPVPAVRVRRRRARGRRRGSVLTLAIRDRRWPPPGTRARATTR